ncbi:hypothetical protein [Roseospirillum parvum]|uniref:Uncharacterized protein n=1 Tax=Roseospirillum parvum TaxID=83401 RepID=A0A1G8B2T5_9PROT|nr:hypothetical protein [Roseospirillum parvum]SDH27333.1 hypothetical protein SAMN05421742_105186 [Roseospirillum parvum]
MVTSLSTYFENQPKIVDQNLKIEVFGLQVRCAPWPFPDEFKIEYAKLFYTRIYEIMLDAGLPRSSLSFTDPQSAAHINKLRGDASLGWFGMSSKVPGKEFGITVSDEVLQIRCDGLRLESLVSLSERIFSRITAAWCSEDLAKPTFLLNRAHTIDFYFDFNLRVGNHKIQKRKMKNYELLSEAFSLDKKIQSEGKLDVSHAIPIIGVDQYIRMDFRQHALKEIDGFPFNTIISIEAPYNEQNSIISVNSSLRMEDEFGFDLSSGLNWETAFVSFFRDIILKRFLENFFCSTEFLSI